MPPVSTEASMEALEGIGLGFSVPEGSVRDLSFSKISMGTIRATTPNRSAAVLTEKIRRQEPFFFIRFGDGALECMAGKQSQTCDGEPYSPALGAALLDAWRSVMRGPNTYVGDWQTASFTANDQYARYAEQYAELIGDAKPTFLVVGQFELS